MLDLSTISLETHNKLRKQADSAHLEFCSQTVIHVRHTEHLTAGECVASYRLGFGNLAAFASFLVEEWPSAWLKALALCCQGLSLFMSYGRRPKALKGEGTRRE